ncbi:MAG TPA: sugar ABC transporter ATP-binding protein [Chthoniobacterales bacterium]|nr:sugar ABC transporter ATP-binding protein [Chthoniobacterales bacterium]
MQIDQPSVRPLLVMRDIRKTFDGVEVLKGVNFDVQSGEVHALVGENGAGKSTLMNILAGVHQPTSGTIQFDRQDPVFIPDEKSAQQLGISIVFQDRSLFAQLTIAENIFAARQPNRFGHIDRNKLCFDAGRLLKQVDLDVGPDEILESLSPAQQQLVEVAKALSLKAKLIIFDEPTSSLTDKETQALFRVIRQLRSQGVGVTYISHRLEEIFQIADRVTVLKDGEWQGTSNISETNADDLVRRMVGRNLELRHQDACAADNPILLDVRGLSDSDHDPRPLLGDISFTARAGEIVGLAGLAGAGRTELALSIFGVRPRGQGEIYVNGRRQEIRSPKEAIAAGIGYAFEDRKEGGLFLDTSIARNIASAKLEEFGSWWLNDARQSSVAADYRTSLRIVSQDTDQVVQSLSGGNQQKVVLAKWLLANPKVLIVDEPTRGIDVGAKAEVHQLLYQLSRKGAAVVVISSELPEILAISDRIYVMRNGRITGELSRAQATEEKIMRLASLSFQETI